MAALLSSSLLRRGRPASLASVVSLTRRAASTAEAPLERTALYALHKELGGKLVPFAGYELPVQFPSGVLAEHMHARKPADAALLFDVGEYLPSFASVALRRPRLPRTSQPLRRRLRQCRQNGAEAAGTASAAPCAPQPPRGGQQCPDALR